MTGVPLPVPIIVGVTGHCKIDPHSQPAVRKAVQDVLAHLIVTFPHCLHVMTALADGADQLVGDAAKLLNIPIIAVLPMAKDRYKEEPCVKDHQKFDELWEHATLHFELPTLESSAASPDRAYEQLGAFLASRCHILLALWEGPERAGTPLPVPTGGTADVLQIRFDVQRAFHAHRDSMLFAGSRSRLDAPHADPVVQIVTPRRPDPNPPIYHGFIPAAGTIFVLQGWTGFSRVPVSDPRRLTAAFDKTSLSAFVQIGKLNNRLMQLPKVDPITFDNQYSYLATDGVTDLRGQPLDKLKSWQAGIDCCSLQYQRRMLGHYNGKTTWEALKRTRASWRGHGPKAIPGLITGFTLGVPFAVLFFELYSKMHMGWGLLLLYLGTLGIMWLMHKIQERGQWQSRFQDYRALAEAIRVQLYWAVSALPLAASDNYLRKQAGELGWIQFALRGPALWAAALALEQNGKPNRKAVMGGWIKDQALYFNGEPGNPNRPGRAAEDQAAANRNKAYAFWLFVLGLAVAGVVLGTEIGEHHLDKSWRCAWAMLTWLICLKHELDVLAVTLLAIAAALAVSRNLRAYEAHAHNYKQMGTLFERARVVADANPDDDHVFRELIRELGREALFENAEWLLDHRDRPVEPGP